MFGIAAIWIVVTSAFLSSAHVQEITIRSKWPQQSQFERIEANAADAAIYFDAPASQRPSHQPRQFR